MVDRYLRFVIGFVAFLLGVLCASGCGNKSTAPSPITGPTNPAPANGAMDVEVTTTVHWSPVAIEGDTVFYRLYFGYVNPPPSLVEGLTDTTLTLRSLVFDTTCFWRVMAYTRRGDSAGSSIWRFRTADHFEFPLEVADTWDYSRRFYSFNPDPDTITLPFRDTIYTTCHTWVEGADTLLGNISVYVIHTQWSEDGGPTGDFFDYRNNAADGHFSHAYSGSSVSNPPKLAARGILFKGMRFPSVQALHATLLPELPRSAGVLGDTLHYEDPPVKVLQYPLTVGQTWVYRPEGKPWRMDREVQGIAWVECPAGTFKCFKVCWKWDLDDDGQWDTEIAGYDYLAPVGVVLREFSIQGQAYVDEFGNILGTFDTRDEFKLTAFTVAPPR